jgi:hypothetical protein
MLSGLAMGLGGGVAVSVLNVCGALPSDCQRYVWDGMVDSAEDATERVAPPALVEYEVRVHIAAPPHLGGAAHVVTMILELTGERTETACAPL